MFEQEPLQNRLGYRKTGQVTLERSHCGVGRRGQGLGREHTDGERVVC